MTRPLRILLLASVLLFGIVAIPASFEGALAPVHTVAAEDPSCVVVDPVTGEVTVHPGQCAP